MPAFWPTPCTSVCDSGRPQSFVENCAGCAAETVALHHHPFAGDRHWRRIWTCYSPQVPCALPLSTRYLCVVSVSLEEPAGAGPGPLLEPPSPLVPSRRRPAALRCVSSEPRLTPPRGAAPFPTTARPVGRLSLGRPSRRLGMATRTRTRRTLTRRWTTRRTRPQPRPRSAAACLPPQRYHAHIPSGPFEAGCPQA